VIVPGAAFQVLRDDRLREEGARGSVSLRVSGKNFRKTKKVFVIPGKDEGKFWDKYRKRGGGNQKKKKATKKPGKKASGIRKRESSSDVCGGRENLRNLKGNEPRGLWGCALWKKGKDFSGDLLRGKTQKGSGRGGKWKHACKREKMWEDLILQENPFQGMDKNRAMGIEGKGSGTWIPGLPYEKGGSLDVSFIWGKFGGSITEG